MKLTLSQETTIRYQFSAFCKKVMREEYRDIVKERLWRSSNEILFCEMSESDKEQLYAFNDYDFDSRAFKVLEFNIEVHDVEIAMALSKLPEQKRDIILLSYFLDMTDKEVGFSLNVLQRTVQRRRVNALKQLKTLLGEKEDE